MNIINGLSSYAIPAMFLVILSIGIYKNVKVYEAFIDGAKEGLAAVIKIVPSLVGLMVAVGVFRASGALDLIVFALKPLCNYFSIPLDVVPMAFLRPISGSASLAYVSDVLKTAGPDSFSGRLVSTMMGSTETIFYTLAVYFGSVGIKNIRYTLLAALIADVASVAASVWICGVMF